MVGQVRELSTVGERDLFLWLANVEALLALFSRVRVAFAMSSELLLVFSQVV